MSETDADLGTVAVRGSVPRVSRRVKRRDDRGGVKEALVAYLHLAPAVVVLGVFAIYPLIRLVDLSLHSQRGLFANRRDVWVGFSQWGDVFGSHDFTNALSNTVMFVIYTVPLGVILGVLLALVAHRRLAGMRFFQTVFSSTVASSAAVASVVFYSLVNSEVGYFRSVSWLKWLNTSDPSTALFAVSTSAIWQNLGLTFVIVLAGMQAIPSEVNEAATLDGYGPIRRLFRVTLPLLGPTLMFLAVVLTVFAFQAYAQIDIMTKGGPQGSTETLVYRIVETQFDQPNTAAVMAIGLFGLTFLITLVQFSILDRRVHYGD